MTATLLGTPMPTSPIPRLTADLVTARDNVERILRDIGDAELDYAVAPTPEQRAALKAYIGQLDRLLADAEGLARDCHRALTTAREALLEKADDRRRDAEADAAAERAELAETRTA